MSSHDLTIDAPGRRLAARRELRRGGAGDPAAAGALGISVSEPSEPTRRRVRHATYDRRVLELRPSCEACDRDLPPDSPDARICTYECTFCAECVEGPLAGVCPNCGGNFECRPIRPPAALARHPASTVRVFRPPT